MVLLPGSRHTDLGLSTETDLRFRGLSLNSPFFNTRGFASETRYRSDSRIHLHASALTHRPCLVTDNRHPWQRILHPGLSQIAIERGNNARLGRCEPTRLALLQNTLEQRSESVHSPLSKWIPLHCPSPDHRVIGWCIPNRHAGEYLAPPAVPAAVVLKRLEELLQQVIPSVVRQVPKVRHEEFINHGLEH